MCLYYYVLVFTFYVTRESWYSDSYVSIKDYYYYEKTSQILPKKLSMVMTSSMTSQSGLKVSLYIHVKEMLAPVASCKSNVSSINANIVIIFLDYTCQKDDLNE